MVLVSEEVLIKSILIMLENMQSEPCTACWPQSTRHPHILRCGIAPDVGMVVADKAFLHAVHFLCGYVTVLSDPFKEVKQRQVTFREVAAFGRPVVHFGIYINSISASPRCYHFLIPYALQVHGLGMGTACGYHEVSAEVEVKFYKLVVMDKALTVLVVQFIAFETLYSLSSVKLVEVLLGVVAE